jgi:acetyl esterase/lipase
MNRKSFIVILLTLPAIIAGIRLQAQQRPKGPEFAWNSFPVPASVRVVHDIVYAQYGKRQLKTDVYLPPAASSSRPVPGIVVVRGGGWQSGDKEGFGFIAGQLAMQGFVAASIEYRTSQEATFPAAVYDVKAAVRWMRANAATYGVDRKAIAAIGGSAGAHLVAMLATTSDMSELEGTGGNAGTSSRVQAVVAMACPCDLSGGITRPEIAEFLGGPAETRAERAKLASPAAHVSDESAPLFLLHSRTDPLVPFDQSVEMERLYRRAGATVSLKPVDAPDTHGFWNETKYFADLMKDAVAFFRKITENTHAHNDAQ